MKFPVTVIKNGQSMGTRLIDARSAKEAKNMVKRWYTAGIEKETRGVYSFPVGAAFNG